MILNKVTLQNYRCFQSVEVELAPTTVLIGENNSGKTSFLDALRLCLSRNVSRRGAGLEDYDYHLANKSSASSDSQPLSITLDFLTADDEPEEFVQALSDALIFDAAGKRHIYFQLVSAFDLATKDFTSDWNFLDANGKPLGPKAKRPQLLSTFIQFSPLFYLSALRDAAKEFHGRATYWAPFLRNPGLSEEVRQRLQDEISRLNEEVMKSHASLSTVKTHLAKVQDIVAVGKGGQVDIEALPGRISDLLSKTQINISAPTGAALPLARHGAGTQSLAVIFLFEAFLSTMLADQYDPLSKPILAVEEPEAHLHPSAARTLWTTLDAINGQKIIATHSGDMLARVPLSAVRRFCRENGSVRVKQLGSSTLTPDEQRKIEFHLRSCRGELLFARCWLLGEGESEYWAFNEIADILGMDLDRLGIRVVNYQHSGVRPLVKVANDLGISWFLAADGDQQGKSDSKTCESMLDGRKKEHHIALLPQDNVELYLCMSGFGQPFLNHVSPQKKAKITAASGTVDYWKQVLDAKDDAPKPYVLRESVEEIRKKGAAAVPAHFTSVLNAAKSLTEAQQ